MARRPTRLRLDGRLFERLSLIRACHRAAWTPARVASICPNSSLTMALMQSLALVLSLITSWSIAIYLMWTISLVSLNLKTPSARLHAKGLRITQSGALDAAAQPAVVGGWLVPAS